MVGGGIRMPIVKQLIKKVFGIEGGSTMHADEAVARGAAWMCAIQSPSCKVRDFSVRDVQPHPITVAFNSSGVVFEKAAPSELKQQEVFTRNNQIPSNKEMIINRRDPITFEARYTTSGERIALFSSGVIPKPATGEAAKLKVTFRLNQSGIFMVTQMVAQEEVQVQIVEPPPPPPAPEAAKQPNAANTNGPTAEPAATADQAAPNKPNSDSTKPASAGAPPTDSKPAADQTPPKANATATGEKMDTNSSAGASAQPEQKTGAPAAGATADGAADKTAAAASDAKPAAPAAPPAPKFRTEKRETDVPLSASHQVELAKSEVTVFQEREAELALHDRQVRERRDAKNALEGFVYEARDKLGGDLERFVSEPDLEAIRKRLTETEDWLYGEGEDVSKQVYDERLKSMSDLTAPIYDRFREAQLRPSAVEEFARTVNTTKKLIEQYAAGVHSNHFYCRQQLNYDIFAFHADLFL